ASYPLKFLSDGIARRTQPVVDVVVDVLVKALISRLDPVPGRVGCTDLGHHEIMPGLCLLPSAVSNLVPIQWSSEHHGFKNQRRVVVAETMVQAQEDGANKHIGEHQRTIYTAIHDLLLGCPLQDGVLPFDRDNLVRDRIKPVVQRTHDQTPAAVSSSSRTAGIVPATWSGAVLMCSTRYRSLCPVWHCHRVRISTW